MTTCEPAVSGTPTFIGLVAESSRATAPT
jgi:hypothetical protein